MYLNKFCFVLVLVTVSASYFDEELPVYLSDDILISKLPSISKRSVVNSPQTDLKEDIERKGDGDNKTPEIENGEESGLVFLPSFGRRSRRSITNHAKNVEKIVKRDTTEEKIPKTSNSRKNKETSNGGEIENEEESGLVFLPSFGRRTKRSLSKTDDKDLLDSESNIVFLPSFKRKGFRRFRRDAEGTYYRQISKRSTETLNGDDEEKKTEAFITEKNEELSDSDTVNGEESGLVFLPSFGRRSRRNVADSVSSSTEQNSEKNAPITSKDEINDQDKNKPLIQKTKRQVETEQLEKKKTKLNDSKQDANDQSEDESGLVFLPTFGRRSRRSVVDYTSSPSTTQKTSTLSSEDGKHNQEHISTLIYAKNPKREVKNENPKKENPKLSDKNEDSNDESLDESGLVFLPSFGRRYRRNIVENSSPSTEQHISTNSPQIEKKGEVKNETSNQKKVKPGAGKDSPDESKEESGLVFLPSFGRRQRRDVSFTDTSTRKEEVTTASTSGHVVRLG